MEEIKLTRKELYDQVWSEPMVSLAKKYHISDVGLRKICVKMDIPLPQMGHWEKIKFGKPVFIEKFHANNKVDNFITIKKREEGDLKISDEQSALKVLQDEIENIPDLPLKVLDRLSNPDKLIVEAKNSLEDRTHRYGNNDSVINTSLNKLDIKVAPKNIGRALRFMDALIKLLRVRGHKIRTGYKESYALIYEQEIQICFREKTKRIISNVPHQSAVYQPTGNLFFIVKKWSREKEWKDGKLPIENQLSNILAYLEIEGKKLKEESIRREKEQQKRDAEKQRIIAFEQNQEKELVAFKNLLFESEQLNKARIIRNYINEVEARSKESKLNPEELIQWLEWARKKADWYDPILKGADELLNDVDKKNLTLKKKSSYYY